MPRAPSHALGVTHRAVTSSATSVDITPPSSLLRTHASDQIPPNVSVFPCTLGLCSLSLLPAGTWPFPTLSPQSLYRCLDTYPVASLRCTYPFLAERLRPHHRSEMFGTPNDRRNATSTTEEFRGCNHSIVFKLPYLLDFPVAPTAKHTHMCPGQPSRLHHASPGWLPIPRCGIATCLNRATGTTGLSAAGLRPCRLLRGPMFA